MFVTQCTHGIMPTIYNDMFHDISWPPHRNMSKYLNFYLNLLLFKKPYHLDIGTSFERGFNFLIRIFNNVEGVLFEKKYVSPFLYKAEKSKFLKRPSQKRLITQNSSTEYS